MEREDRTLDSLQYLTSLVVNKDQQDYVRVKTGYRKLQKPEKGYPWKIWPEILPYKVRKTRKPVVLEPMNPYERRIIHSALQGK